eukprot:scaffold25714_cov30-Tisochrysis_lutea.AAC.9
MGWSRLRVENGAWLRRAGPMLMLGSLSSPLARRGLFGAQGRGVLTRSDVCNRRASCSHGGEGTTTLGVAVQLRNDDRANGHLHHSEAWRISLTAALTSNWVAVNAKAGHDYDDDGIIGHNSNSTMLSCTGCCSNGAARATLAPSF